MATETGNRREDLTNEGERQQAPSVRARPGTATRSGQGPFHLMRQMTDQFDRMLEALGDGGSEGAASGAWMPRIDVRRGNGTFTVQADLPGVERDDVQVEIRGDALWIEGERRHCEDAGDDGYGECIYGSFLRVLPLPAGADVEHASARFENGVLAIEIPTPEESTSRRRIAVEGAKAAEAITAAGRAAAREAERKRDGDEPAAENRGARDDCGAAS